MHVLLFVFTLATPLAALAKKNDQAGKGGEGKKEKEGKRKKRYPPPTSSLAEYFANRSGAP